MIHIQKWSNWESALITLHSQIKQFQDSTHLFVHNIMHT